MHPMARSWADMTFEDSDTLAFERLSTQSLLVWPPAPRLRPAEEPFGCWRLCICLLLGLRCTLQRQALYIQPALACFAMLPGPGFLLRFIWSWQTSGVGFCSSPWRGFRSVLQRWQLQLRGRCWQYRLTWNEAYMLFGADVTIEPLGSCPRPKRRMKMRQTSK